MGENNAVKQQSQYNCSAARFLAMRNIAQKQCERAECGGNAIVLYFSGYWQKLCSHLHYK